VGPSQGIECLKCKQNPHRKPVLFDYCNFLLFRDRKTDATFKKFAPITIDLKTKSLQLRKKMQELHQQQENDSSKV